MTDAYRDALRLCPACARAMDTRTVHDVVIDVCSGCKGLWLDWFDGELAQVAHDAAPLSLPRSPAPEPGTKTCPDCRTPLAHQAYQNVSGLFRCGECAGTFVPRTSFEALAQLTDAVEEHPRSALRRLVDAILHLLDDALP
jgi:Zn-finger nucleic acid-binding protein